MECPDCGSMDAVQQACPRCAQQPAAVPSPAPASAADQPIGAVATRHNTLPMIGFCCMLAGPCILSLAGILVDRVGYLSLTAASLVSAAAIILPAVGAVLSWVSISRWGKIGTLGRALAIVTAVTCNPLFYFMYFLSCSMASKGLAGLPAM